MIISINLGILNLLPIPILDGGQALVFMVEAVKRGPLSLRTREIVQQVGLVLLVVLMGFAFWNDFARHWSSFLEWLREPHVILAVETATRAMGVALLAARARRRWRATTRAPTPSGSCPRSTRSSRAPASRSPRSTPSRCRSDRARSRGSASGSPP